MRKGRILVVDDDAAIVRLVCSFLQDEGYTVTGATRGAEAVYVAQTDPVDLILLDRLIPDLEGAEVVAALRAQGVTTPIVAFSALDQSDQWATDLNLAGYLAKPFDLDALLALVQCFCTPRDARPGFDEPR